MNNTHGVTRKKVHAKTGHVVTMKRWAFVVEYMKDFNHSRAALASGHGATTGGYLLNEPDIIASMDMILEKRMEEAHLDAEWLLYELYDNHRIARTSGNITASNTALGLLAKHVNIDAFAAVKVDVKDSTVVERLQRGRQRASGETALLDDDNEVSFF